MLKDRTESSHCGRERLLTPSLLKPEASKGHTCVHFLLEREKSELEQSYVCVVSDPLPVSESVCLLTQESSRSRPAFPFALELHRPKLLREKP